MTKNSNNKLLQLEMLTVDQMMPEDHLVTPIGNFLSIYMNPLISATADAFRWHGFSLLVATLLRGLQLMLFPPKSPPALQSASVRLQMIEVMDRVKKYK